MTHLLFRCKRATEVWRLLGLENFIKKACGVDRAGESVLDFLMQTPAKEIALISQANVHELISITS